MKKRIKLPDPGPAELEDGKPWILGKSIIKGKCRCFNSDKIIPNVASYFIMGHFKEKKSCEKQIKDCNRKQI